MTLRQRWKQTSISNQLSVIVGAFAAFAAILSVVLLAYQTYLVNRIEADSSAQTERLIAAADAAVRQIKDANEQQLAALNKSAAQSGAALEATATEAAAQSRAARSEVDVARDAMRLDRRAWVSIDNAFLSPHPLIGTSKVFIEFANHGPTPATNVREIEVNTAFVEPCTEHSHSTLTDAYRRIAVSAVLGPGSPKATREHHIDLSQAHLREIRDNRTSLYVFGGIEYRDIFQHTHVTRYCFVYDGNMLPIPEKPERVGLGFCGCHNDVN